METHADSVVVGQALIVSGAVNVRSAGGVSQLVKPNSPIHLDDRIDTGGDGTVTILFADSEARQLDIGSMSSMIVDDDVAGGSLPELGDVAVEAGVLADLLQNWDAFEPVAPLETMAPGEAVDDDVDETVSTDSIPGLDSGSETIGAAEESGGDGLGSIDDDLDMASLIPPPEDAS